MELDKIYEARLFEPKWAKWWVDEKLFVAETDSDKPTYSLIAPPPNVTGALHMGHCFEIAMTDITIRWRRMSGDNVLWLPGLDHAGIATQMLVERHLKAQGIDRREIGREKFLEHVWTWKEEYGGKIVNQFKRIGASCDWSRQRFTMDPGVSRAVNEAFVRLYERGLLYRGEYMVNWDPGTLTALSDLEVVHEEQKGHLWHLRYPITGLDGEYVVVATTRPETMLGDTAVAVHPDDERYKHLVGKTITLPFVGRELKVIFDDFVDPEFGTGIVKITPAHDPNDFATGQKHGLEIINILTDEARINANGGKYEGLDRYEARKQIVADLEALGLIEKIEDYVNKVGKSQRSGLAVEPRVSMQWFIKTKSLAEPSIEAVESGQMEIMPEQWRRNYFEWMHNIRDWCVSRQLWWGHRIPAWYTKDGEMFVARNEEDALKQSGGRPLRQDDDVLDTWFSSGLWPFSTMGWPDETPDLKAFYPNSLLITGFDILFFWVARMTMLGIAMMDQPPFRQVLIHGLVRDADKKKMSKTKGNVIDPIEMTEKYGTDAVRFALVSSAGQGSDVVLSEERIAGYATFANKIWNAMRFVFMSLDRAGAETWTPETLDNFEALPSEATGEVPLADRWMFSRLDAVAAGVNENIQKNRYHDAANQLYQFFWKEFCDWYIELKKIDFTDDSGLTNEWKNMLAATERALRLLHPLAPFITEELWQRLTVNTAGRTKSLAFASYPQAKTSRRDADAEHRVSVLQEATTGVRNLRAEMNIPPRNPLTGILYSPSAEVRSVTSDQADALARLACVTLSAVEGHAPEGKATHHTAEFDLEIELPEEQKQALKKKLAKQLGQLEKAATSSRKQLDNEAFLAKAPESVVASIKEKLTDYESQIERIKATLEG
jgi:valyl-tRNA synthetase